MLMPSFAEYPIKGLKLLSIARTVNCIYSGAQLGPGDKVVIIHTVIIIDITLH